MNDVVSGAQSMLIALLAVLAVLSVPVAGGRLSRLLELRLRHTWVLLVGLVIQVVIISILPGGGGDWLHRGLHLATYGLGFAWLAVNSSLPWRWILTIGGALNFLAIAANDGVMPASHAALVAAGEGHVHGFTNSVSVAHAHLAFLGDVFAAPSWLPFGNVFSIGDVLIVVGAFLMLHAACGGAIGRILVRSHACTTTDSTEHSPRSTPRTPTTRRESSSAGSSSRRSSRTRSS